MNVCKGEGVIILAILAQKLTLGASTVKTNRDQDREHPSGRENFFDVSRFSWRSRSTFFSRSRFLKLRLFNRDLAASRFLSRCRDKSRLFKIYRDISTLSRLFEVLQDQKSRQIYKSRSRNVIKLIEIETNCLDLPKISCLDRFLDLDRRDLLFESVEIFSTVETGSLPVSRSRVSIKTRSRQNRDPQASIFCFLKLLFCVFFKRSGFRI